MTSCRICSSSNVHIAFTFSNHSIVHHLKNNASDVDSYTGNFELYECLSCGFLFAGDYFAPQLDLYKNYITLSGMKTQIHAQRVVDTIGFFSSKPNPRILEIGCNDGSFIKLLFAAGFDRIDAVEPATDAFHQALAVTHNVVNDFFSIELVENQLSFFEYDIVVTRQVLEHISDLHDFLQGIKLIMSPDGLLVIEIPDHGMNYCFSDYSFWEEHINYFTLNTLRQLLAFHGFSIFYYESAIFTGQALIVYCTLSSVQKSVQFFDYDADQRRSYVNRFPHFQSEFKSYLQDLKTRYESLYVYGAGCRSLCLINFLDCDDLVSAYIDDSPDKANKYTAGSSKPILHFQDSKPDAFYLLGVNAEVESRLISSKKLAAGSYCGILPPSNRLPAFWQQSFCQFG